MQLLTRAVACPQCGKSAILSVRRLVPVTTANTLAFQLRCPDGHQSTRMRLSQMWLRTSSGHSGPAPRPTAADELRRGRFALPAASAMPPNSREDPKPSRTHERPAAAGRTLLPVQDRAGLTHTIDLFDGEALIATLLEQTRPPEDYYDVGGRCYQVVSDRGPAPTDTGLAWRAWVAPVVGSGAL